MQNPLLSIFYISSLINRLVHAPGPGLLLLTQTEGKRSFGLMVTFLMFYPALYREYYPGPGESFWLKIETDLQSCLPFPIVRPCLGSFVNSEEILYLSGEGELFFLCDKGLTVLFPFYCCIQMRELFC